MAWSRWCVSLATMAVLAGSLALPVGAQERDDRDATKQEILKAVERLMDKKLREFKGELMRDIKEMLTRDAPRATDRPDAKPARRLEAQPVPARPAEGPGRMVIRKQMEGPAREARQAERNLRVVREDGKVRVRLETDGKVMEKEFELGDPEIEKWMGRSLPEGFQVELPGRGRAEVRVLGRCPCEEGQAEGPQAGRGRFRIVPFGEIPRGEEGRAMPERLQKEMERWMPRQGRGPRAEGRRFRGAFGEEARRQARRAGAERGVETEGGGELERLEREKNELKREIAELRDLLKQLAGKKRRR